MKLRRRGRAIFFIIIVLVFAATGFSRRHILYRGMGVAADTAIEYWYALTRRMKTRELNTLLYEENQELKAALSSFALVKRENALLKEFFDQAPDTAASFLYARTFPDPHNTVRNYLAIDAGAAGGIRKGAVVLWTPNIFLGEISEVYAEYSIVKTIFDGSVAIPVHVGERQTSALLVGGANPLLDLIPKEAEVASGDAIITAAGYGVIEAGLFVGNVLEVRAPESRIVTQATIRVPYAMPQIREVFIKQGK